MGNFYLPQERGKKSIFLTLAIGLPEPKSWHHDEKRYNI